MECKTHLNRYTVTSLPFENVPILSSFTSRESESFSKPSCFVGLIQTVYTGWKLLLNQSTFSLKTWKCVVSAMQKWWKHADSSLFINTHQGIKQCNHVKTDIKMPRNWRYDKQKRSDEHLYNESGTSAPSYDDHRKPSCGSIIKHLACSDSLIHSVQMHRNQSETWSRTQKKHHLLKRDSSWNGENGLFPTSPSSETGWDLKRKFNKPNAGREDRTSVSLLKKLHWIFRTLSAGLFQYTKNLLSKCHQAWLKLESINIFYVKNVSDANLHQKCQSLPKNVL